MLVTRLILTGSATGCEQYGKKEIGNTWKVEADLFLFSSDNTGKLVILNHLTMDYLKTEIHPSRQSVFRRES